MTKRVVSLAVVLFCTTALGFGQEPKVTPNNQSAEISRRPADADSENLRANLEKMRVLLGQMQRNVAFVSTGDTPLKHQFQLEIEMWQLLIRDIENSVKGRTENR